MGACEMRQPKTGRGKWLGSYFTPQAAAPAYDTALLCSRGPNAANLNFPDSASLIDAHNPPLSPRSVQNAATNVGTAFDIDPTATHPPPPPANGSPLPNSSPSPLHPPQSRLDESKEVLQLPTGGYPTTTVTEFHESFLSGWRILEPPLTCTPFLERSMRAAEAPYPSMAAKGFVFSLEFNSKTFLTE